MSASDSPKVEKNDKKEEEENFEDDDRFGSIKFTDSISSKLATEDVKMLLESVGENADQKTLLDTAAFISLHEVGDDRKYLHTKDFAFTHPRFVVDNVGTMFDISVDTDDIKVDGVDTPCNFFTDVILSGKKRRDIIILKEEINQYVEHLKNIEKVITAVDWVTLLESIKGLIALLKKCGVTIPNSNPKVSLLLNTFLPNTTTLRVFKIIHNILIHNPGLLIKDHDKALIADIESFMHAYNNEEIKDWDKARVFYESLIVDYRLSQNALQIDRSKPLWLRNIFMIMNYLSASQISQELALKKNMVIDFTSFVMPYAKFVTKYLEERLSEVKERDRFLILMFLFILVVIAAVIIKQL